MDHPNIIKLYHTISNEKNIYLIMEYTSPVCLNTFTRGRPYKRLAEDEAKPIIKQIIDAVYNVKLIIDCLFS
jgi:MAP/microtubule affinity-regulating kinase